MLPLPTTTFSSNVRTMFASTATPVASSAGELDATAGPAALERRRARRRVLEHGALAAAVAVAEGWAAGERAGCLPAIPKGAPVDLSGYADADF